MNTTEFLAIASAIVPERVAIIYNDKQLTYQGMAERTNRLASSLMKSGVQQRDRIGMFQVNCSEYLEAYFGVAKTDAVFVPLNFRAKSDELKYLLTDSEPKVLFVGNRYAALFDSVRPEFKDKLYVDLEGPTRENWISYEDFLKQGKNDEIMPKSADDETTVLMYTSGTTGVPKGVMLAHDTFSSYILSNVNPPDLEVEERNILTVPMYHIAGLQAAMAAVYGGRTLILERQFKPDEWMQLVEKYKANRAMMVPTMLGELMEHPDFNKRDLSSLKVITYGAAPMPLEVIKKAIYKFPGVSFINAFGQTETGSTITMLPPEDHVLKGSPKEIEKKLKHLTSIGTPLPGVEIRILDEDGKEVPLGHIGEIVARGSRLMKGYWGKETETAQVIRDGWLYTGDLGCFDEEGYIYLKGRIKDIIKRGGEMIAPLEVENVLCSYPKIKEAAVIGIPDNKWGESARAIVVLNSGEVCSESEIIEYCRQNLASYKKPESVIFVEDLPKNQMGKVLKRLLRELYCT